MDYSLKQKQNETKHEGPIIWFAEFTIELPCLPRWGQREHTKAGMEVTVLWATRALD